MKYRIEIVKTIWAQEMLFYTIFFIFHSILIFKWQNMKTFTHVVSQQHTKK